jgi:hypothetical protein
MSALQLKYFTRPEILQQIGHIPLPVPTIRGAESKKLG